MSKFVYPGLFPFQFCIPEFDSIEQAYNLPPDFVLSPLEMPLKYAMALFWRVKSFEITASLNATYTILPPESVSTIFNSVISNIEAIPNEEKLVCTSNLSFFGQTDTPSISDFTIDYNSFFTIKGNNNIFWRYDNVARIAVSDVITIVRDVANPTVEILNPCPFTILDRTFFLMLGAYIDSEELVTSVDSAISISANLYWPYANNDGSAPTYNTSTGLPL